jgi:hypothetical protein
LFSFRFRRLGLVLRQSSFDSFDHWVQPPQFGAEKPPAVWSSEGAQSPDGRWLALGQRDGSIDLVELRPLSEAEILYRRWKMAFDAVWQEQEAARHEKAEQWFAAAFHLRQLLAHKPADADKLKERVKRCEEKLRLP